MRPSFSTATNDKASTITFNLQSSLYEITPREVTVKSVQTLGNDYVRLIFCGESLHDFVSLGFDDHVKVIFSNVNNETLRRNYTPRAYDQKEETLTIDFALHPHGDAANWAENAAVGTKAIIAGPRMTLHIDDNFPCYYFIGDATALPAINRKLETLGENTIVKIYLLGERLAEHLMTSLALVEVFSFSDERMFKDNIISACEDVSANTFIWGAGEYTLMQEFKQQLNHPKHKMRIASYWRKGEESFHQEHNK
ncbi:MAG: siderophore-interacting protein [Paraglaciecola sp.]|uniref:siderophore-interacting protein n=1 Tax=Paraglaciecola sp. TaxID=1920173 RepID=UPI00329995C3